MNQSVKRKARILVVDDDPGLLRLLTIRLRAENYEVEAMESAAQALKDGITREAFPQGTVFSMGLHPRRDGKPAGDRGESGLFLCPKGSKPEPGKHCDSVAGNKSFGAGQLPKHTPATRPSEN